MSSRSKLHSLREYSLFAAHINNCYRLALSRNISFVFYWCGGSVARSAGQNTVREQKNREKNERQMSGEQERHNSSHHGDPERGQSSPRILSEPRLTPPPPQISRAASHGRWMGQCGSPWLSKRHKHANERAAQKKPVFPLRLSADHFGLSSPQILCPSSLGSVLLFMFRPPVITSLTISPPLRHPVSVCLEK